MEKTEKMTVRRIRRILFENNFYAVVGADEMTNKEARDFLFEKQNQGEILNVITKEDHLLIYN